MKKNDPTLYAPVEWNDLTQNFMFEDILYHKSADGIAKITINRPRVRNAFRPKTVMEMERALADARFDADIGVIIFTGAGDLAFCSGGDQKIRGDYGGYKDDSGVHHLNVLDLQRQIRTCPKPVVAMVAGYAIGGGHVLHLVCDLTIAADNAVFGQTGPKVGSFDGGFGASYMARIIGQKKAPIPYDMKSIAQYTLLTFGLLAVYYYIRHYFDLNMWVLMGIGTLFIGVYILKMTRRDFPLSGLPVVGKYFK